MKIRFYRIKRLYVEDGFTLIKDEYPEELTEKDIFLIPIDALVWLKDHDYIDSEWGIAEYDEELPDGFNLM